MKKGDYIVIAFTILTSILIFTFTNRTIKTQGQKYVEVSINGKTYKRYSFGNKKKYKIDSKYGHNEIEVGNDYVKMVESDCKDKICIHKGIIKEQNDSIICLPNRLIISIKSDKDGDLDVILH